jgi:tRNA threonylcarbamoyladenosine biosynthesis protein TsaE
MEDTQDFGERVGRFLRAGDVVALYGDLGSGKTTLIQGIARGLGHDPDRIKSPTFVLLREYPGEVSLIHVDGYRLEGAPAVSWLDLDLIFSPHKITLIEWAERFAGCLPDEVLEIRLVHKSTNQRKIIVTERGSRSLGLIETMKGLVS